MSKYQCFNGNCVDQLTDCEPPPSSIKPLSFSETLNTTQLQVIEIASADQSILCNITIPAGTFEGQELITITFGPMADSEIRSTLYDDKAPEIYSSVVAITVPPTVPQPFKNKVEIACFISFPKSVDVGDLCLAFVMPNGGDFENQNWNCTRPAPTFKNKTNGILLVGQTDHFTSYAALLGQGYSTSESTSNAHNSTSLHPFIYIIIGVGALVLVIGAIIVGELYRRRIRIIRRKELNTLKIEMHNRTTNEGLISN